MSFSSKGNSLLIFYWDIGLGGVQRKIFDISRKVISLNGNNDVTLLLNINNKQDLKNAIFLERIKISGVRVVYIPRWRWRRFTLPYTLYALFYVWKYKPNVILSFLHRHGVIASFFKQLFFFRKLRVVIGQDIILSQYLKREFDKDKKNFLYWKILVKFFYPLVDLVIFPSKLIGDDLADNFNVPKGKLKLIHNWVLKQSIRKTKRSPKYDLIYVGRISAQKRPLLLIDIFREILIKHNSGVKMCIVGYGEYSNRMKIYSRKNGIVRNVFFAGSVEDIYSYLTDSKIFLLASAYEGEPISVLEAMSAGLPVVSMKYEGSDELITNGRDGYVCSTKNEAVENSIKLLSNNRLRVQMGKKGAEKIVKNYSDRNLERFVGRIFD